MSLLWRTVFKWVFNTFLCASKAVLLPAATECRKPVRTSLTSFPFWVQRKPYTTERRRRELGKNNCQLKKKGVKISLPGKLAPSVLGGVGLSLDPEGKRSQASAHRLPALSSCWRLRRFWCAQKSIEYPFGYCTPKKRHLLAYYN